MTACSGKEAEPETEKPTEQPKEKGNTGGLVLFLCRGTFGGGGAFYYFKFMKPKQSVKGDTDLEDFDFDDYGEDEPDDGDILTFPKMKKRRTGTHDAFHRKPVRKNDGTKTHRAAGQCAARSKIPRRVCAALIRRNPLYRLLSETGTGEEAYRAGRLKGGFFHGT